MDLASAPVRPGFVLAWIVAVTGSAFLVMDWICPPGLDRAASAASDEAPGTPAVANQALPVDTLSPAVEAQFRSISPVSDGDPLDFLQADPEDPENPEDGAAEDTATPVATAAVAQPGRDGTAPFQALRLPIPVKVLSAGVAFSPLALDWVSSSSEGDEPEVQLQVYRTGRGLFLLRLLLARYQDLGLDAVPENLLSALPPEVLSQLKDSSKGRGGGNGNGSGNDGSKLDQAQNQWKRMDRAFRRQFREQGREFMLLLTEEQMRELRLRLLANRKDWN